MDNNISNIVISGYPKSGTSWLTRLIQESIPADALGFLGEGKLGSDLTTSNNYSSKYKCYKTHISYNKINEQKLDNLKIIHIIRDPLDIVASSIHFFHFNRFPNLIRFLSKFPTGLRWYYLLLESKKYRIKVMSKILIKGNEKKLIHPYSNLSWLEYNLEFFNKENVFLISYEQLLNDHIRLIKSLLFINKKINTDEVKLIYERNSAKKLKEFFRKSGDKQNFHHIRNARLGEGLSTVKDPFKSLLLRDKHKIENQFKELDL